MSHICKMDKFEEEEMFIQRKYALTECPSIPVGIKAVDLKGNCLSSLLFAEGNAIEYIDVSDNKVGDIEPLNMLNKAHTIDCSYNIIDFIPNIHLPNLSELYLMANDIKKIENLEVPRLKKLDFANNDIRRIENLGCPMLEELYLSCNEISKIENLEHLKDLKTLDLQYNQLEEVDCSLVPETIEILMLQGNRKLKRVLNTERLKNLKMVNLKDTPLSEMKFGDGVVTW